MNPGRLSYWDIFKHVVRVQFFHPPHSPLKLRGKHRA